MNFGVNSVSFVLMNFGVMFLPSSFTSIDGLFAFISFSFSFSGEAWSSIYIVKSFKILVRLLRVESVFTAKQSLIISFMASIFCSI